MVTTVCPAQAGIIRKNQIKKAILKGHAIVNDDIIQKHPDLLNDKRILRRFILYRAVKGIIKEIKNCGEIQLI